MILKLIFFLINIWDLQPTSEISPQRSRILRLQDTKYKNNFIIHKLIYVNAVRPLFSNKDEIRLKSAVRAININIVKASAQFRRVQSQLCCLRRSQISRRLIDLHICISHGSQRKAALMITLSTPSSRGTSELYGIFRNF